jgi:hypothetical protein
VTVAVYGRVAVAVAVFRVYLGALAIVELLAKVWGLGDGVKWR